MLEKLKANILFHQLLKRPDISKAYKMVGPEDSWYDTISTVHRSLAEIQKLPHDTLTIKSHDGLTLKGIYYPCEGAKVTAIWMHGYTSHAERESAFPGLFYRSLGFNVLIPYLRAHDMSEGKYIAFGALEHKDLMGWVDKINELTPNGQIVLHGLSMGGGVSLFASDKEMENVKCLIADAPSVSIAEFFDNVSRGVFKDQSGKVSRFAQERFFKEFGAKAEDFDARKIVSGSKYPILLSAGSNEHLEELFETLTAANPMPTEVIILPGCNHGNGMYKQTELYQGTIKAFLDKHLA